MNPISYDSNTEAMMAKMLLAKEMEDCVTSTSKLAKKVFPDTFYSPFSTLHDQIFQAVDGPDKKVVIAAPRGIGKTTIARTLAARYILFRMVNFVTYVSSSASFAEQQTENLKRELLSNSRVKEFFGSIKNSDRPDDLDDQFSKLAWVAFGNTLVLPRGSGQQVRGLNWRNHRPQLIVIDDLENKEDVRNPENRRNLKEWFHSDLLKCVSRYDNNWKIVYIDTFKHPDSLLAQLLKADDWKHVHLSICDENMRSFAPEYMSDTDIRRELKAHRDKGIAHVFYMEYMNMAISPDDATFKAEYFRYYKETDQEFEEQLKAGDIESVVIIDPAKSHELHAAYSAVVCWGVNRRTNRLYFRDAVARMMYPDELYDETFKMAQRFKCRVIGIEVTSLDEFITYPFKTEMSKRGLSYEIIELKARKGTGEYREKNRGKEGRIAALVPEYRQGRIFHNEAVAELLEEQLLQFPSAVRWDVMDAAAYIIEMLELGERYFMPEESNLYDPDEDEYAELLEFSDPLPKQDDWRFY